MIKVTFIITCTYNAVKLEKINEQYMQYLVLFFGFFFGKLYVSPGSTKESLWTWFLKKNWFWTCYMYLVIQTLRLLITGIYMTLETFK